ncbi:MAG TPA: NFACT RNA binding domain-containing protein [Candidatus Sulfotelmatobacter sp.]|nr:NFACT RNA binding domain-containing protein [Candidatus Sulfotelmatobacter sp.]
MSATSDPAESSAERFVALLRELRRQRARLARKAEAIRGDLAEAERAPEYRRFAEALLAYLTQVPKRAARVTLADPHDASHSLEIPLDPSLTAQANAARYFKRAAKGERGAAAIRARLERALSDFDDLDELIGRGQSIEEGAADEAIQRELEAALRPARGARPASARAVAAATPGGVHRPAPPRSKREVVPARLLPRRLRTEEGWDVLIGRSNEGNDHLTLHLARPEDYWFHVHGAAGSHVVLRRGKGKNEPSKQTLERVASWTAFYSQARTAGKVPVIWTLKKYVRKPRGAKAGTVVCEREKTIMVRPSEPQKSHLAEQENSE